MSAGQRKFRGESREDAVTSTVLSSKCEALCHTYRHDTADKTRVFASRHRWSFQETIASEHYVFWRPSQW